MSEAAASPPTSARQTSPLKSPLFSEPEILPLNASEAGSRSSSRRSGSAESSGSEELSLDAVEKKRAFYTQYPRPEKGDDAEEEETVEQKQAKIEAQKQEEAKRLAESELMRKVVENYQSESDE